MGLQMEIEFKEKATIEKGDLLYLDFQENDRLTVVVTSPDGSQQTPKAKVVHAPTMEELY